LVNHAVVHETSVIRAEITRGPAILGNDNDHQNLQLDRGDTMSIRKHPRSAVVLSWERLKRPADDF